MSVCRPPSHHSVPTGPTVTTGVCLGWQFIRSAGMEALMQQCQAAEFSKEVSRLVAAPRRPSTNRMYDNRWLCLDHWAAGEGIDLLVPQLLNSSTAACLTLLSLGYSWLSPQTIKGYRSCLASVLSHTCNAAVVQAKTISDMITSMELQRPRMTLVLPQWDLGIVLEVLSKSPYEPLQVASLKHLTLKTVFLLAIASAGKTQ